MDATTFRLLNDYQRAFPLRPRPFAAVAEQCGLSEDAVIASYRRFIAKGTLSRIGAVFRPNTVGASALAALAVPPRDLARVAAMVSDQPEVNHNYEREHRFNLWFVVTAVDVARVGTVLDCIERTCGLMALRLPLQEEYHIDLGFDLANGSVPRATARAPVRAVLNDAEQKLVAAIGDGIPLHPWPYAQIGERIGLTESAVLDILRGWLERGVVRRFGAVVRHLPLGYRANAMVVWNVPDDLVAETGRRVAVLPAVTLCYRRARHLPDWPYNLFCMIHGKERAAVERVIEEVTQTSGLEGFAREVLFSRRCFAQRGARYAHG